MVKRSKVQKFARRVGRSTGAKSVYKIGRKTMRSGARSIRKRGGAIVGHAMSGNVEGLRGEAAGVGRDMKRTAGKATQKAVRYTPKKKNGNGNGH